MFLKCSWFCFIMLLSYFHYTDNSHDSDVDILIYQLVLKRKAKAYEEEESLDDEQEEDEESNIATDDEGMCILGCVEIGRTKYRRSSVRIRKIKCLRIYDDLEVI